MSEEKLRALQDGLIAMKDNPFWQLFWAELTRKREYLRDRLADAGCWEEICRLQGELSLCRQLILLVENTGKGEQA